MDKGQLLGSFTILIGIPLLVIYWPETDQEKAIRMAKQERASYKRCVDIARISEGATLYGVFKGLSQTEIISAIPPVDGVPRSLQQLVVDATYRMQMAKADSEQRSDLVYRMIRSECGILNGYDADSLSIRRE